MVMDSHGVAEQSWSACSNFAIVGGPVGCGDNCGDESQSRVGLQAANLQFWVNRMAAGLDLIGVYGI